MHCLRIQTNSYYDAGKQIGVATKELHQSFYTKFVPGIPWKTLVSESLPYLAETKKSFPHFVEEMRGLADGIEMPFERVWAFNCRDEVESPYPERCSSVFIHTNSGWIVGHNEDDYWNGFQENEMREYYFMVSKTISGNGLTYLACPFMIGGETVSVNSSGIIQTINTLYHAHNQIGVPKNIIARAVSEAKSIEEIKGILAKTKRASGYCHNLLINNNLYCIESTENNFEFIKTTDRFVHTNYFQGLLSSAEDPGYIGKDATKQRCAVIENAIQSVNAIEGLKKTLLYKTESDASIYRKGDGVITMASTIIDTQARTLQVAVENKGDKTDWRNISIY